MLAETIVAAQTIVIQTGSGIRWEAVLVTAVPAAIAAVAAVLTAVIGRRNRQHLESIDRSVNGVQGGSPTMRQKVEAIAQVLPGAHDAAADIAAAEPPQS